MSPPSTPKDHESPISAKRSAALELLARGIAEGESAPVAVSGTCMEPLIIEGDCISVVPLSSPPPVGTLVLAHTADGELVCHRVLYRAADGLWLAGDRTMRVDHHTPESVLGRVVTIHRGTKALAIRRAGVLDRLQVRLHLFVRRHHGAWWIRFAEWPRRLLIELRGLRWWPAR